LLRTIGISKRCSNKRTNSSFLNYDFKEIKMKILKIK
jgi:hypothetical protein